MTCRRLPIIAATFALLTACGSTVAQQGAFTGPTGAGSELGEPLDTTANPAGGSPAPGTSLGSTATGGEGGIGVTGASPITGSTGDGSTGTGPPASVATGVKRAPVEIGLEYKKGLEEAGTVSGFRVIGADGRAVWDAIIAEVNRSGGLQGHPVKPVYVELPAQTSETAASLDQRMCAAWTEDHHVTAVVSGGGLTDVLPACLQKKGIPFLFVSPSVSEKAAYARYPLMHTLYPGQYRAFASWIDVLAQHSWFGGSGAKIGLLRYDTPDQARIAEQVVKPALKKHGLSITAEVSVNPNASDGGIAAGKAAMLQFQQKGVTHLLPQDTNGNMVLFAMKMADSNAYHPKWALTSYVLPYIQQTNNQSQLTGAAGLGWAPAIDVDDANDPGPTPARTRCLDIMRRHGVAMRDRSSVFQASYSCDLVFMLQVAANRAPSLTASSLKQAFATVQRFDSAAFGSIGFTAARRDAATSARYFTFVDSCLCFRYATRPFAF